MGRVRFNMTDRHRTDPWNQPVGKDYAWALVTGVVALLAAAAVFNAMWRLVVEGSALPLLGLPLAALFYWWVGVGAWRRTVWSRRSMTTRS